jgi:hypothetical protein
MSDRAQDQPQRLEQPHPPQPDFDRQEDRLTHDDGTSGSEGGGGQVGYGGYRTEPDARRTRSLRFWRTRRS